MKPLNKPPWDGHPEADLLLFAESHLEPERRIAVADHLAECRACAEEVETLRQCIRTLSANKEAFCPEPWDILELVCSGKDPDGRCSAHIKKCRACREEVEALGVQSSREDLPDVVWKSFLDAFPVERMTQSRQDRHAEEPGIVLRAWNWLSRPLLTVAAVAAAAAVMVLVLPKQEVAVFQEPALVKKTASSYEEPVFKGSPLVHEPSVGQDSDTSADQDPVKDRTPVKEPTLVVGLSSVEWPTAQSPAKGTLKSPRLTMMSPSPPETAPPPPKPKLAIVLLLKGRESDFSQTMVDNWYRTLTPSTRTKERFDVLPPSAVKEAAGQASLTPTAKPEILSRLSSVAGVAEVVFLTVCADGDLFAIEGERCQGATGETVKSSCLDPVEGLELEARLRGVTDGLLENAGG